MHLPWRRPATTAGARSDGLGTGDTGKIKAIVHAGSRITGIVPGA